MKSVDSRLDRISEFANLARANLRSQNEGLVMDIEYTDAFLRALGALNDLAQIASKRAKGLM